jgi:hypothetical protein
MAKRKKRKTALTPEQKRNSDIFRLRGFYANAKTLPFRELELNNILACVDSALDRLGAQTQSQYLGLNKR